jgi:hypothetical protein
MKKRWFKESFDILRELQAEDSIHGKMSPDKLLKLWELYSLNYYYLHQYPQALFCIDTAIILCPTTNLSSLARYFFLRGKLFQALCSSATAVQFPTSLKPSQPFAKPDDTTSPPSGTRVYMCTGDLIQVTCNNMF